MVWIVFAWVLGISLFTFGWGAAVVKERGQPMYAALAILGVIIVVVSAIAGEAQRLVTY